MAPTRKSRSVNKRYANEVSPAKDVISPSKSKQKKLSDKLGPQWSKGELQRFYEAYRNYGKDWKKVAAQVRNRSAEMVEALYNMNRAYLSLPEGTASVVGLIAMMTDHYNVMEGSDSERESNDASEMPRKSQKRKRAKVQLSASKEDISQSWSMAATGGCLSLLKRSRIDGNQPRAVKKRTPRFPVSYSQKKDDRDDYIPLNKKDRRSAVDANDDEVAHVAALALTEASQRGGSPQVSQSPHKKTEHGKSSPVQTWDKMFPPAETAHPDAREALNEEGCPEARILNRRPENGAYTRARKSLMDMEGVGTVEVHRKGKKFYRKKMKVEEVRHSLSDDEGEACSGTEEGLSSRKGKVGSEISNAKNDHLPLQMQRKRSKKLFFGDESTALNALQTLADLSLMLPDSTMESESSVQLKEERTAFDIDDKSSAPEETSTSHPKEKIKHLGPKEKALNTITEAEDIIPRKSKLGRYSGNDVETVAEVKEQPEPPNSMSKRKRKSVLSKKISNSEAVTDTHMTRTLESEAVAEEHNKFASKGKRTSQNSAQSKQWKPGRVLEGSSVNDQNRASIDLVAPTGQAPVASPASSPTKHQSRRKMDLKRKLSSKEMKFSENSLKTQPNKNSLSQEDRLLSMKEKLSGCLSSNMVRRWCTFEWFYSAIDYPWFSNREFVEYLNHVGLGHIPRLTRVEWGVIRSSLGKPRRLSKRFLHDEREKLKQYRESVRKHYAELRTGVREGLPRDLPRPLSVGQRVIAIHPKTRELHDGSVLTIDHDKCRVQFDRPELGVEFVMDIDSMPSNPLDNMPEALRRQISADKFSAISKELQVNGHPNFGSPMLFASDGHLEKAPILPNTLQKQAKGDMNHALPQAKSLATDIVSAQQAAYGQLCTVPQIQAREATVRALSEVNRALSKKEALLMELKNTNNDILESQNGGESSLKDSEPLKKHIATVLVQLKEANDQASSALLQVRQCNTHPESSRPSWPKHPANVKMLDNSHVSQESGSAVAEIVNGSRLKAHTMVDAAVKAMSSVKEGEDAYTKIGEALDHIDKRQLTSDPRVSVIRSPEQVNGSLGHHNHFVSGTCDPQPTNNASGTKLQDVSDKNEAQIPSELITSCVATLLMIQTCTERHTPADVAQIIDSAVSSLHPCCPQNLPIYREIEMCMGRIKTQILALIPTSI
ncbi:protein ALWAYS EARLY 2 isoform X2 [Citrus sinensis]|uniref:protein ALWAYS EARLY 2 isoform X2 n=1 Tax=Citrus sinensis TaxID=2711 RepID=UPI002279DBA6|nr:protein ALWAYS EARLY 2 isoform X2 [Citrus sinensis]